jgi:hypothetical protein
LAQSEIPLKNSQQFDRLQKETHGINELRLKCPCPRLEQRRDSSCIVNGWGALRDPSSASPFSARLRPLLDFVAQELTDQSCPSRKKNPVQRSICKLDIYSYLLNIAVDFH